MALLEGLRTGDADVLAAAKGDELHEAPRADLNPRADVIIRAAQAAGAPHAAWSGAGPAVIAFADAASTADVAEALRSTMGAGEVRIMDVATRGLI
jgi:homoserine kinase